VVECYRVTGEDCFVLRIEIEGLDRLDHVLDRFLAYGQTTTSIVQSVPVPRRGLPLPGEGVGCSAGPSHLASWRHRRSPWPDRLAVTTRVNFIPVANRYVRELISYYSNRLFITMLQM
jgi:hypothetical protein